MAQPWLKPPNTTFPGGRSAASALRREARRWVEELTGYFVSFEAPLCLEGKMDV